MSDEPFDPELDLHAVERAIRRLPFLEREALMMKARDRMTNAEIGAVLGISAAEAEAKVAAALVRVHARSFPRRRSRSQSWLHFRLPHRFRRLLRRLLSQRGRG